jgi:hypothetical protein
MRARAQAQQLIGQTTDFSVDLEDNGKLHNDFRWADDRSRVRF